MNLCSEGHNEVCYEGHNCPCCDLIKQCNEMNADIETLCDENKGLKKQLELQ
jgi:hypothetical protein